MKDTFEVLAGRAQELCEKIERLNRKAVRYGLSPVETMVLGHTPAYARDTVEGREWVDARMTVRVVGGRPTIPGWRFMGTIQHLEAGNVMRMLPGEHAPDHFRSAKAWCAHCNTVRRRKDSYMVLEESTGKVVQLGRDCVRDYLGGASPQSMARAVEFWSDEVSGLCEEGWGGGGPYMVPVLEMLALGACACRTRGWVSRKAAEAYAEKGGHLQTTASLVGVNMDKPTKETREHFRSRPQDRLEPSDEDRRVAAEALEWAKSKIGDKSEYLHNLGALLSSVSSVEHGRRDFAMAVSAVGVYMREQSLSRERERKGTRPASQFVGEPKRRMDLELTLRHKIQLGRSDYGQDRFLLLFEDDSGNVMKWFTGYGQDARVPEEGERFKVRGTVKAHEEYRGVRQTALTRCSLSDPLPAPAAPAAQAQKAS